MRFTAATSLRLKSRRSLALACAIWMLAPTSAHAFGTWDSPTILGQQAEHERITRTLACGAKDNEGFCLQAKSLDQIAGTKGYLGGVGEPDSITEVLKGPGSKHCDDGDFLLGTYPLSRANATSALKACVDRFQAYVGHAVAQAGNLVGADGKLSLREAALDLNGRGIDNCSIYDSVAGERPSARAKCAVFANLGRAAHIAQDFWSHSNWGDRAQPAPAGISTSNPPGLNNSGSPDFLRFPMESMTVPELLATGCDDTNPLTKSHCANRIFHGTGTGLNKDKGVIDPATGRATSPATSRGGLYGGANFQAVVTGARMQTRLMYHDFVIAVRKRYGLDRGKEIGEALSRDVPWTSCKKVGGDGKGAFSVPRKLPDGWRDTSVKGSVVNRTGVTPVCESAVLESGEGWGQLPARPGDLNFSAFGQPGGTTGRISFGFPGLGTVDLHWKNPLVGSATYSCSTSSRELKCSATKISGAHGGATYAISRAGGSSSAARASTAVAPTHSKPAKRAARSEPARRGGRPAGAASGSRAERAEDGRIPRGLDLDPCGERRDEVTEELGVFRDGIGCTRVLRKLEDAFLAGRDCPKGWEREPGVGIEDVAEAAGLPPMHLCWVRIDDDDDDDDDEPDDRDRELRGFTYLPDAFLG